MSIQLWLYSQQRQGIFLFSKTSRPTLEPARTHTNECRKLLSRRYNWDGMTPTIHLHIYPSVRSYEAVHSYPRNLQGLHRDCYLTYLWFESGQHHPVVLITNNSYHTITTPDLSYVQFVTSYYMFHSYV
jgi:hypothetical protein